ncbi:MAG TPA: molybdopterin-binding protein [Alphaproteobacteria bacterium]|nr:molybdopterin-binding protein [Alphaproteobacteria bacterium]
MSETSTATAASARTVTAAVLIIGNEILSGRTKDANLPFLAAELNKLGVRVMEARVVPDIEARIVEAVNALRRQYDYVFTTGGIGPTHDDITAESIAKAFGVALERHPEAVARLARQYKSPSDLNEARLRMANVPAGGILIDNPVSAAPGFQIGNVFVMAGIPSIMQGMFGGLKSRLVGGAPVHSRSVATNLPEGRIAEGLGALQKRHPEVEIGSYPFYRAGQFGVSLVIRGTDVAALERIAEELKTLLRTLGGDILDETSG